MTYGTTEFAIFETTLGSGGGENDPKPQSASADIVTWSVCLVFRLELDDLVSLSEEDRFKMLQAIEGLSPILTVRADSLALTLTAVGTRDEAVRRALESAWVSLDACGLVGALIGMDLITDDRIDASLRFGEDFVFDSEMAQAVELQTLLDQIKVAVTPASFARFPAGPRRDQKATSPEPKETAGDDQVDLDETRDPTLPRQCLDAGDYPEFCRAVASLLGELDVDLPQSDVSATAQAFLNAVRESVLPEAELVGQSGAAALLGVSRQRAHQILRGESAIKPVFDVDGRPVWTKHQIDVLRSHRSVP